VVSNTARNQPESPIIEVELLNRYLHFIVSMVR